MRTLLLLVAALLVGALSAPAQGVPLTLAEIERQLQQPGVDQLRVAALYAARECRDFEMTESVVRRLSSLNTHPTLSSAVEQLPICSPHRPAGPQPDNPAIAQAFGRPELVLEIVEQAIRSGMMPSRVAAYAVQSRCRRFDVARAVEERLRAATTAQHGTSEWGGLFATLRQSLPACEARAAQTRPARRPGVFVYGGLGIYHSDLADRLAGASLGGGFSAPLGEGDVILGGGVARLRNPQQTTINGEAQTYDLRLLSLELGYRLDLHPSAEQSVYVQYGFRRILEGTYSRGDEELSGPGWGTDGELGVRIMLGSAEHLRVGARGFLNKTDAEYISNIDTYGGELRAYLDLRF